MNDDINRPEQWEVKPVPGQVKLTCYSQQTGAVIYLDPGAAKELADTLYEAINYLKNPWPRKQRWGIG